MGTELNKLFRVHQTPSEIPFQFHKDLVDDIRRLMCSLGPSPLDGNAHCGISPLSFGLMSMVEVNQLRKDQEARNGATSITPGVVRVSKRKYPTISTTFDQLECLWGRYICARHLFFTKSCHLFEEVVQIKQDLLLVYRRNGGGVTSKHHR